MLYFGRPLLDQMVLERERLDDRVGDDDLEARGFVEQRVDARAHAVRAEIAADAVAQHARLADVERVPAGRCNRGRRPAAPAAGKSGP